MPSRSFVSKAICILQTTPHPYSEAPSSPSECAFQKVAALHSWRHSGRRWVCIKLLSFSECSVEHSKWKSPRFRENQEKAMTESKD